MHENTKGAQMQDHHKVVKSISGVRTMIITGIKKDCHSVFLPIFELVQHLDECPVSSKSLNFGPY